MNREVPNRLLVFRLPCSSSSVDGAAGILFSPHDGGGNVDMMDGNETAPGLSSQLTQRQRGLVRELSQISTKFDLGAMFEGACHALRNQANPETLPQSAHSLRELMEKLEGVRGIPITESGIASAEGSLGEKTKHLAKQWTVAEQKSACLRQENPAEQIDAPLRKVLGQIADFFGWVTNNQKLHSGKPLRLVKGLDPLASMLPQAVQEAQADEWRALKSYFQEVSHHKRGTDATQFAVTLAALEVFLDRRLAPVRAANQTAILKLIKEVES